MEMPQQSRMPGLMVYGSSGIGKTMIAKRMISKYPTRYDAELGTTKTPILLVQAPPAPDETEENVLFPKQERKRSGGQRRQGALASADVINQRIQLTRKFVFSK